MSFDAAASAPRRRSLTTPMKIEKPDTSESDSLTAADDSGTKRASGSSSAPQDGWKHVGPFRKDGTATLIINCHIKGKQNLFRSSAPRDVLQQYVDVINKYKLGMGKTDNAALLAALRAAREEAEAAADATAHPLTTPQDAAERMEKEMAARFAKKDAPSREPARYEQNYKDAATSFKNAVALSRFNAALADLFAAQDELLEHHLKRQTLDDGPVLGAMPSGPEVVWGKNANGKQISCASRK